MRGTNLSLEKAIILSWTFFKKVSTKPKITLVDRKGSKKHPD